MSRFDHKDYVQNPSKYQLFNTATVAANIFTHNGAHDVAEGTIVGIKYIGDKINRLYRRYEPCYRLLGTGMNVYANTLRDFVL